MRISEENFFVMSMQWRIGYGILRIIFGLALLKVVKTPFLDILNALINHELGQDPNDFLYLSTSHLLTKHPLEVTYFLSFYFIFWGIIDIVLSHQLIKHRLWAFPLSMFLIGSFVLYEILRFAHNHSLVLLFIIFIDIGILWLIKDEYKKLKFLPSQ